MRGILTKTAAVLLAFASSALSNVQVYKVGQSGADDQGFVTWTPQTIIEMTDDKGQYFDLEFEVDANLVMWDNHGHILWQTNTGGHDCRTGPCILRWTPWGQLQILVETQRGPQPIWQTNAFTSEDGHYLNFGAIAPYVAVYTKGGNMSYPQPDLGGGDLFQLCQQYNCYECYSLNCWSGGDDGTQGAGVWGSDPTYGNPGDDDDYGDGGDGGF